MVALPCPDHHSTFRIMMVTECPLLEGKADPSLDVGGCSFMDGGLNRSAQHFILNGKDGVLVRGQGYCRGFTAAEKTELWDRWQRGESLKAIGRAFGKPRHRDIKSLGR